MAAIAHYPCPNACRHIQQLAKHFVYKIALRSDTDSANFTLQAGHVRLEATDGALIAQVKAVDQKSLIGARYVIGKHLVIFAFRDGFTRLDWKVVEAA